MVLHWGDSDFRFVRDGGVEPIFRFGRHGRWGSQWRTQPTYFNAQKSKGVTEMKKVSVTILSILFIFTATSSLCYAGNATLSAITSVITGEILNGCYKKENGQLRLVNSTDQCLPSEMPISVGSKRRGWSTGS
jgi:hypothetical protein